VIVLVVLVACCATVGALLFASDRLGPRSASRAGRGFAPGDWLWAAVTSRGFLTWTLVTFLAATALVLLGGLLWRAGAQRPVRPGGQEGQAILEFVMVLPIGLMLVLVMVQSSLLMVGHICVHYAAYCAARSAVVSVPADLSPTEPPNFVTDDPTASGKMRRVHLAAVWAVLPISCSSPDTPEGDAGTVVRGLENLFSGYGKETPSWVRDHLGRKLQYAEDHTQVSLSPPEEGDTYKAHEDIVVTVRHTFYMAVPYAGKLFAVLSSDDGVELAFAPGEYGMQMTTTCRLTNEGVQDWVEAEKFPRPTEPSDPPEFGPWYDPWKDWQHGN
jgi:hypothetical protein